MVANRSEPVKAFMTASVVRVLVFEAGMRAVVGELAATTSPVATSTTSQAICAAPPSAPTSLARSRPPSRASRTARSGRIPRAGVSARSASPVSAVPGSGLGVGDGENKVGGTVLGAPDRTTPPAARMGC